MNVCAADPQEMSRDLLDSIEGIVWEYDLNANRYIHVGPQIKRILGYLPDAWLGKDWQHWVSYIHPDDRERVAQAAIQILWHQEHGELEYRFRAQDGRYVWLHDAITMVGDWAAERRALSVSVEITGSMSARWHGDAPQQTLQARQAMGEHVVELAHDFNDVLAAVMGFSELAAANERIGGDEKLACYIDEIRKCGLRGLDLVEQLLGYCRSAERLR